MGASGTGLSRRQLVAMLIAASAVFLGALVGAFVSAGGADRIFGDGGGDDEPSVEASGRRGDGSAPGTSTSATSTAPATTNPETTTPSPSDPSASTAPSPAGDEQPAAAMVRARLDACAVQQGVDPGIFSTLQYAAVPGPAPDVFTVTVTAPPPEGETATFTVDVAAATITAVDDLATEFVIACPNFEVAAPENGGN